MAVCACVQYKLGWKGRRESQGKRLYIHPSTWMTVRAERVYPSDGFPIAQTHIHKMRHAERFRHDVKTTQNDLDVMSR